MTDTPIRRARPTFTDQEALQFHAQGRPGKLEVVATKPMATQRDLSLAYSPGVAVPVLAIAADPSTAFDYTARANLVAVISNGTAILGLGNLGALASKPVMEGKAVLFKRFADVDSIDLEVDTEDPDQFINAVRYLGPSFGGINLEDIKAPECFIIEERLRELMDIPVFHDDQHGTAIIAAAGILNALHLTGRRIEEAKLVVNGAGAAGIACAELVKGLGFRPENVVMCDTKGVIWQGRTEGMNQWKSAHAVKTDARSLADAMVGADVVFGLSAKGAFSEEMLRAMAPNPIIFAMANPDPEITPEEAHAIREDIIIATGRSDYPNQVNNVLGFPYIFRGALDVRATTINMEMKVAAARALADLAREDVPDEVAAAYQGARPRFGRDYIIPVPFDPRLIHRIPMAVAQAAMDTGVARKPIVDMREYRVQLSSRRDPVAGTLNRVFERVRRFPKRVVFAEGEEEQVMRAAVSFVNQGLGKAILVGREDRVYETARQAGIEIEGKDNIEVHNARLSHRNAAYAQHLYDRMQRQGFLFRDCQRLINTDRNHFGAAMVALGDADAMVTGATRNFSTALEDVRRLIDPKPGHRVIGISLVLSRGRTVLVADTAITEMPSAQDLADIAIEASGVARRLGYEPKVAMLAFSTFGHPKGERAAHVIEAVKILDGMRVDFEYDGEMAADVALNREVAAQYPFSRLTGPANVLVMPAFHSASISTKMLQELGGSTVVGPMIVGLDRPVQLVSLGARDSDIVNMAALAAFNIGGLTLDAAAIDKIVVFDIGNVLIEWDMRHLYRTMFEDDAAIDAFIAEAGLHDWNRELDRRGSFAEAVTERIAAHPKWESHIRAFDTRWHDMVPGAIPANVAVLERLKAAGRPVYAITNFSKEKFAEVVARFPFLGTFDGVVVSAHEELLKPDLAIYRRLIERYGLDPQRLIFVDDTLVNVEAAKEAGMDAIHVTPGIDLAAALRAKGVKNV